MAGQRRTTKLIPTKSTSNLVRVNTRPLTVKCPECGSDDVVYSCEPECCFNHVCGECLTSFQLRTCEVGKLREEVRFLEAPRDSLAATVACAACNGLRVEILADDCGVDAGLVCADCTALLKLEFGS